MNPQQSKVCPQCGGRLAANARICYCGHDFFPQIQPIQPAAALQPSQPPVQHQAAGTPTETKHDAIGGAAVGCMSGAILGMILIIAGIILCLTGIGAIIGVPLILFGFASFGLGPISGAFMKTTTGACPYCGAKIITSPKAQGHTCPACQKRMLVRDGQLQRLP